MKKMLFALLLLPFLSLAQDCKLRASAGGHEGTSDITKKELTALTKLDVKSDCAGTTANIVVSYEFTVKIKGNHISYTGKGPLFTEQMKAALDAAQPGGKIFFDNVKVKEADGKEKTVPGIVLNIKP